MFKIKKFKQILISTIIAVLALFTIVGIARNIRNARADEQTGQQGILNQSNLSPEVLFELNKAALANLGSGSGWNISDVQIDSSTKSVTFDLTYNALIGYNITKSNFSKESIVVYIGGEEVRDMNVEILNSGNVGSNLITYTVKLSDFSKTAIAEGKTYIDYSGIISIKIASNVIETELDITDIPEESNNTNESYESNSTNESYELNSTNS